jgi:hypothetical protein
LDGNDLGVSAKVGVGGENLPSARNCDTADQEINARSSNTLASAFVAPMRGSFEILSGESFILKARDL